MRRRKPSLRRQPALSQDSNHHVGRKQAAIAERTAKAIKTTGEIFQDGTMIEPVGENANPKSLNLLFWDGRHSTIDKRIFHDGRIYEAAAIDPTILRAATLPTKSAPYGSVRQLLTAISALILRYSGFPERHVKVIGRFVLSSWFIDAIAAPRISIIGPDTLGGTQLFRLLNCLCRHAIALTEVSVEGIHSLPMQWQFTFLIRQPEFNIRLQRLLSAARRRNEFVPQNGRLVDFHCAVATYSELRGCCAQGLFPGIEIPVWVSRRELPVFDDSAQQKICEAFQPQLLGYRLANYRNVCNSNFDTTELTAPMLELARALGACTPGDATLQGETVELLRGQDACIRSDKWTKPDIVIIEAILAFIHEGKMDCVYMGQIGEAAETILAGRGEYRKFDPKEVAARVRLFGLVTEPRNSKGVRLLFTQGVCRRVHELARDYDVPSVSNAHDKCKYCKSVAVGEDK